MASKTYLALITSLCCLGGAASSVLFAVSAHAETFLTQATIQRLRAQVELHDKVDDKRKEVRAAKPLDVMTPGDALRTYRQAMAELRFNDRSLARIGEQAVFEFQPNTRNFDLKRGTVLLLIRPGQGKTRVRTPNAAAGIRGSALFVRYIAETDVTMVGALTNSDIEISNNNGQTVVLKAGQMGFVYQDRIGVQNFNQRVFQDTSPLFRDINWDEAPIEVKAELEEALTNQPAIAKATNSTSSQDSPAWIKLPENREIEATVPSGTAALPPVTMPISAFDRIRQDMHPGSSPVTPPAGQPPVDQPPIAQPPVGQPLPGLPAIDPPTVPVQPTPPTTGIPSVPGNPLPPGGGRPAPLPPVPAPPVVVNPAPLPAPIPDVPRPDPVLTPAIPAIPPVPGNGGAIPAVPPVVVPPVATPPVVTPPVVPPAPIVAVPDTRPTPPVPPTVPVVPVINPPLDMPQAVSPPTPVPAPLPPVPAPVPPTPDVPVVPAVPATPATPATPAVPADPGVAPATPAIPAVPATP